MAQVPSFQLITWVGASTQDAFDLSRSIDVHRASMAGSGEEAVEGVTAGLIGPGESVTLRARHFGVTFRMKSRVTEFDPPHRFVDEQVEGPFERWRHLHVFATERNGTTMTDLVEYEAPGGVAGWFVDRAFLRRYLVKLIGERNRYLKETLETGKADRFRL